MVQGSVRDTRATHFPNKTPRFHWSGNFAGFQKKTLNSLFRHLRKNPVLGMSHSCIKCSCPNNCLRTASQPTHSPGKLGTGFAVVWGILGTHWDHNKSSAPCCYSQKPPVSTLALGRVGWLWPTSTWRIIHQIGIYSPSRNYSPRLGSGPGIHPVILLHSWAILARAWVFFNQRDVFLKRTNPG